MDNAMVKRGIGAIVLAVIAAVLLGYLLKDKSRERQEVVEMKLPGAPEMNIPSLSGGSDSEAGTSTLLGDATATLEGAKEKAGSGAALIVASATGAASTLKDSASDALDSTKNTLSDAADTISNGKPGFAIRPSMQNEQREINDNTQIAPANTEIVNTPAPANNNQVVASAKVKQQIAKTKKIFKPQIIEKKKPAKVVKKAAPKAKPTAPKAPKSQPAPAAPTVVASGTASGKYSIQLLATSSQSRATKLAKTMKGEGYNVFITQTTRNDKILYRVRVGGHKNRDAAIKAQDGMKKRYQKNFFVQNSLVVSN